MQTTALRTTALRTTALRTTALRTTALQPGILQCVPSGTSLPVVSPNAPETRGAETWGVETRGVETRGVETRGVETRGPEMEVSLLEAPLSRVRTDFGNHRWETSPTKSLSELSESLAEHGLLQRPRLRPHPTEDGCYQVIYGHRRVMAAGLLGWERIPAEVQAVDDAAAVRSLQMQENLRHLALSPIEEAIGMEQMVRLDRRTQRAVARELGYDPSEVKRRLDLLRLSGRCVEHLHAGRLKPAHGAVLYKHLKGDEGLQDEFASRAVAEKLSAEVLEQYIKEHLEGEETEAAPEELRIPPMGPTPTTVYAVRDGLLPEEGEESGATAEERELYTRLAAVAALMAFGDHELRSGELGLPLPYVPADVAEIYAFVTDLSASEGEALLWRLTRRFFEAGHRAKLMPEVLIVDLMREGLSAPPAGSEKP